MIEKTGDNHFILQFNKMLFQGRHFSTKVPGALTLFSNINIRKLIKNVQRGTGHVDFRGRGHHVHIVRGINQLQ